jgi:hypothetical protein
VQLCIRGRTEKRLNAVWVHTSNISSSDQLKADICLLTMPNLVQVRGCTPVRSILDAQVPCLHTCAWLLLRSLQQLGKLLTSESMPGEALCVPRERRCIRTGLQANPTCNLQLVGTHLLW